MNKISHYVKAYFSLEETYPAAPYLTFGPLLIAQLIYAMGYKQASLTNLVVYFIGGLVSWTLIEYILHRFFFHATADKGILRIFNSGLHQYHHHTPASGKYIAAPMLLGIPVYAAFYLVFYAITRDSVLVAILSAGVITGYLLYEWVHYAAHLLKAHDPISRYLKKYHLTHHFKHPDRYFGVTSPLWDKIFGIFMKPGASEGHAPHS